MNAPAINSVYQNLWYAIRDQRGEAIRYSDGDLVLVGTTEDPLLAVPTQGEANQLDGGTDEVIVRSEELEFLISPSDLVDGEGAPVLPREGSTIEIIRLGIVYEIKPSDGVLESWRYSGPDRTWYRIRTAKR